MRQVIGFFLLLLIAYSQADVYCKARKQKTLDIESWCISSDWNSAIDVTVDLDGDGSIYYLECKPLFIREISILSNILLSSN